MRIKVTVLTCKVWQRRRKAALKAKPRNEDAPELNLIWEIRIKASKVWTCFLITLHSLMVQKHPPRCDRHLHNKVRSLVPFFSLFVNTYSMTSSYFYFPFTVTLFLSTILKNNFYYLLLRCSLHFCLTLFLLLSPSLMSFPPALNT